MHTNLGNTFDSNFTPLFYFYINLFKVFSNYGREMMRLEENQIREQVLIYLSLLYSLQICLQNSTNVYIFFFFSKLDLVDTC